MFVFWGFMVLRFTVVGLGFADLGLKVYYCGKGRFSSD